MRPYRTTAREAHLQGNDRSFSPGVYVIVNERRGYVYVGATWRSIRERWQEHRADLEKSAHYSPLFQADWKKDGADAFDFIIAEVWTGSRLSLRNLESEWMRIFLDQGYHLYNRPLGKPQTRGSNRQLKECLLCQRPFMALAFQIYHSNKCAQSVANQRFAERRRAARSLVVGEKR